MILRHAQTWYERERLKPGGEVITKTLQSTTGNRLMADLIYKDGFFSDYWKI